MDDDRTQQTLDDLAELFLTGTAPQPPRRDPLDGPEPIRLRPSAADGPRVAPPRNPPPGPPSDERAQVHEPEDVAPVTPMAAASDVPDLRLTSMHDDAEPGDDQHPVEPTDDLPTFIAEHEELELNVATAVTEPWPREEMPVRTSREIKPTPSTRPTKAVTQRVRPHVEAVLLGNLPGLAHAWLTQYAQLLAQRDGPVLLVTLDDDTPGGVLEAELIEPTLRDVLQQRADDADAEWDDLIPRRDAASANRHAPSNGNGRHAPRHLRDLLDELLLERDTPVATVLVYADTDPSQIDRLLDVGVWTLLTGADETAVVAGYRGLKTLVEADPDAPGAEVGVFVMGSDAARATSAAQKIAAACDELFDTPIEPLGHLQKMRPAAARALGQFPDLDVQWNDLLDALIELPAEPEAPSSGHHAEPAFTDAEPVISKPPASPRATKIERSAAIEREPEREASVPSSVGRLTRSVRDANEASSIVTEDDHAHNATEPTTAAKPSVDPKPERESVYAAASNAEAPSPAQPVAHAPGSEEVPALPALLTAALPALNLVTLPARGPDHPDIDLALDAAGRLHLLLRLADAEHPRAALLELCDARRWAVRHRALLALACPAERPLDPTRVPAVHLFTHQPDQAVPLAATIDPNIRLHLLQHLPLAAGPSWLATPLQTEA